MRQVGTLLAVFTFLPSRTALGQLPATYRLAQDWLIDGFTFKARCDVRDDQSEIILSIGM